jgi:hypothetical protein
MRTLLFVAAAGLLLVSCVLPWSNVREGPGWQLLSTGQGLIGEAYRVRVATSPDELFMLLTALGVGGDAPIVDFSNEIVAAFSEGNNQSCPERRLDGVTIDPDRSLVYSQTSDPARLIVSCPAALGGSVYFVVALRRDALPPSPFVVRLREQCLGERCGQHEEVTVDLRP